MEFYPSSVTEFKPPTELSTLRSGHWHPNSHKDYTQQMEESHPYLKRAVFVKLHTAVVLEI